MTLLGIGPAELVLILVLALLIFGPNKLPEVARTIGKAMNDFRRTSQDVTSAVTRELDLAELSKPTTVTAPSLPSGEIQAIHNIPLDSVGKVVVVDPVVAALQEESVSSVEPSAPLEEPVSSVEEPSAPLEEPESSTEPSAPEDAIASTPSHAEDSDPHE
jgi:sec-independent protein translocase protein TatB